MTGAPPSFVRFYFVLHGKSFDPDEVTRRLGIKPTSQHRPGDPITEDGEGERRRSGWVLKFDERETHDIDEMLMDLRKRVSVPTATVRQVCKELEAEAKIVCGVGHRKGAALPAMVFPPEFLMWVADMGASLDVDVIL